MLSFETQQDEEKTPLTVVSTPKSDRLKDSVKQSLKNYFSRLKGEKPKAVYDMVLSEVEMPLLECVIHHTKNNQVKMAKWLGLSRGTLRQKLKKYGLLDRNTKEKLKI
jgi:Fis family transcriptional regulator